MEQSEVKTVLISKWAKKKDGVMLKQVVVKTPTGKKRTNGKPAFTSRTKHVQA